MRKSCTFTKLIFVSLWLATSFPISPVFATDVAVTQRALEARGYEVGGVDGLMARKPAAPSKLFRPITTCRLVAKLPRIWNIFSASRAPYPLSFFNRQMKIHLCKAQLCTKQMRLQCQRPKALTNSQAEIG